MADVFNKANRSRIMATVRSTGNKATELWLVDVLRDNGIKGWRRHEKLPGKPDFVFKREKVAVFVDGCFWHGCPRHLRQPESNREYWFAKINRNIIRDRETTKTLRRLGWTVLRLWEHDLKNQAKIVCVLRAALGKTTTRLQNTNRSSKTEPCRLLLRNIRR